MIPLKLSIQGIYSYQQEQQINFEHLSEAQLFGILVPLAVVNPVFLKLLVMSFMLKLSVSIVGTPEPII